jgi:defect-in-organelle-trafficking protein DotC
MSRFRASLAAVAVVAGFACVPTGVMAGGSLTSPRVPPDPTPDQVEQNLPQLGNPLNKPITGGSEDPLVVGTEPPPSLEALQATRPGDEKDDGLEPGRAEMVRTAGLIYGAQGGLAARSFALNEMLRR